MKVELTRSQVSNLAEFIEMYMLAIIREDVEIDGFGWVLDMCDAYKRLKQAELECEEVAVE